MQERRETGVQSLGGELPWRRAWQFTPVFLPGEARGQRSLEGYSPEVTKSWTRLSDLPRAHTHTVCSMLAKFSMMRMYFYEEKIFYI